MQPWLDKIDVEAVLGELPESFPLAQKLTPLVNLTVSGWLTDLLGKVLVAELKTAFQTQYNQDGEFVEPLPDTMQAWAELIRPFLVLAVWSDYIRNGNVSITKTGPVTKRTELSDPIDADQRADLSKSYYAKAKEWAVRISAHRASLQESCKSVSIGSKRTSVTVLKGRRDSYFLDR